MAKVISAILILFLLSTGMELEISRPEKVEVVFSTGTFEAEILSVRDSTLVLVFPPGADEKTIMSNKAEIFVLRNDIIYSITKPGTSYVGTAMVGGSSLGCMAGCLVDGKEETDFPAPLGRGLLTSRALGLGAGGTLLGAIVGIVCSSRDSLYINPQHRDFNALRTLARYPDREPDFLKEIRK